MQTTAALALLIVLSGSLPAGADLSSSNLVRLVRGDSAHTLITPNALGAGRAGQIYELPQGGFGVSAGGTSHYQTFEAPGGSGIAIPGSNGTFSVMGSGGRAGTANMSN